jgi:hypothetical protein
LFPLHAQHGTVRLDLLVARRLCVGLSLPIMPPHPPGECHGDETPGSRRGGCTWKGHAVKFVNESCVNGRVDAMVHARNSGCFGHCRNQSTGAPATTGSASPALNPFGTFIYHPLHTSPPQSCLGPPQFCLGPPQSCLGDHHMHPPKSSFYP